MRPYKKPVKELKDELSRTKSFKKKDKIWMLERKWISQEAMNSRHRHILWHWRMPQDLLWSQTRYATYMSPEHAIEQMNKALRSFISEEYFGVEMRLVNKITGEIINLQIKDNKVVLCQNG